MTSLIIYLNINAETSEAVQFYLTAALLFNCCSDKAMNMWKPIKQILKIIVKLCTPLNMCAPLPGTLVITVCRWECSREYVISVEKVEK